jgi:Arc/MetJ family transcription regulator
MIKRGNDMRTNIVIDDELMGKAMLLTGITTKREVVEEALRTLIRQSEQKAILGLRGKIQWDGDLNEMRQGRYLHESKPSYGASE